jgi:hypothetical protein
MGKAANASVTGRVSGVLTSADAPPIHSRCAVAATGLVRNEERVGITVAANPTAA